MDAWNAWKCFWTTYGRSPPPIARQGPRAPVKARIVHPPDSLLPSAAARWGVSAGHQGLRRLPARNRSMHSRISAFKVRSGVFIGQPTDNGLPSLYSAIQLSNGTVTGGGSPTSD